MASRVGPAVTSTRTPTRSRVLLTSARMESAIEQAPQGGLAHVPARELANLSSTTTARAPAASRRGARGVSAPHMHVHRRAITKVASWRGTGRQQVVGPSAGKPGDRVRCGRNDCETSASSAANMVNARVRLIPEPTATGSPSVPECRAHEARRGLRHHHFHRQPARMSTRASSHALYAAMQPVTRYDDRLSDGVSWGQVLHPLNRPQRSRRRRAVNQHHTPSSYPDRRTGRIRHQGGGQTLARVFARDGYHTFDLTEYPSLIKGGQTRTSSGSARKRYSAT